MLDAINSFLVSPLAAVLLLPFLASFVTRRVNSVNERLDKEKSLSHLASSPHVYVGATYAAILNESGDSLLCGPCVLTSLELGRVEVRIVETGYLMDWSAQEFKKLHPVYIPPH